MPIRRYTVLFRPAGADPDSSPLAFTCRTGSQEEAETLCNIAHPGCTIEVIR